MTSVVNPPADAMEEGSLGTLQAQREAWERRPLVREIYEGWYRRITAELSATGGPTVEIECGMGTLKESLPQVIATDMVETPWTDQVLNAHSLPYADGELGNLVMVDVLHHLPEPLRFLAEARRALAPGGRVVMVEPFCSPLSVPLWRRFHHEPVDLSADVFSGGAQTDENPWDANIALPTVIFWRELASFQRRFPELAVITRDRFSWLLYPLSGGFSGRQLAPYRLRGLLRRLEELVPLERLVAFRCLVTLERSR